MINCLVVLFWVGFTSLILSFNSIFYLLNLMSHALFGSRCVYVSACVKKRERERQTDRQSTQLYV